MSYPSSNDPPPPPPPPPAPPPPQWRPPYQTPTLGYRTPGPEPRSQGWTDEDAYSGCLIYGLLGLTVLAGIAGVVWWIVSSFFGA